MFYLREWQVELLAKLEVAPWIWSELKALLI